MNNNILTSIISVIIVLIVILQIVSTMFILKTIEKHSVHPTYGNYKKVSLEGFPCQPWDSCQ